MTERVNLRVQVSDERQLLMMPAAAQILSIIERCWFQCSEEVARGSISRLGEVAGAGCDAGGTRQGVQNEQWFTALYILKDGDSSDGHPPGSLPLVPPTTHY